MSDVVIKADKISKRYRIGNNPVGYKTLRESIIQTFNAPFRKHYDSRSDTFWALKDVSFEVKRGQVLGVIGRNGAGKSTLLKILSRITKPTTGYVRIRGRVGSLLEVGTGFHPELTGRENIYLNGAILGMKRSDIQRKFEEIVAFAEIEKFLDTPVKFYSSGMYMRLAFSVAAHLEPEILLVDEVLAVGDAQFQSKCLGKMEDVAKEGRTVIFVSHNLGAVVNLCQRGILLSQGTILMDSDVNQVVSRYVSDSDTHGLYQRQPDGVYRKLTIDRVSLFKDGEITTSFNNSDTLHLRIESTVNERIPEAQIAFELCTELDECLFTSTNQDLSTKEAVTPGSYIYECPIPLHLLREGRYVIKVSSSIPAIEVLDIVNQPITFDVHDVSSPILRLGQGRKGFILPIFKWDVSYMPAETTFSIRD